MTVSLYMKQRLGFVSVLISFILADHGIGQTTSSCKLTFQPVFGVAKVECNDSFFKLSKGDSIQFSTLRFYISGIELMQNKKMVWKEKSSFHLLDAADPSTLTSKLDLPTNLLYDQIKCNIGVDSTTNVSGAMGGDLDPTRGMYWTWQSGYINCKLEGTSNLCKTRNNEFSFHLGGYQFPFNSCRSITLNIVQAGSIHVLIDLAAFFATIDLSNQNQLMSPSVEAVSMADKWSKSFKVIQQ